MDDLSEQGIAPMLGLDDALTAFEAASFIGQNWASNHKHPALTAATTSAATPETLTEFAAKKLLKKYGLTVPKGAVCRPKDAVKLAEKIGYPVTMKTSSSAIAHKTEAGGVVLNLTTAKDVRTAATRLGNLSDEILIERMVTGAVAELIIGITRDPQFGLALVVGAGGVLTELLKDSVTFLLPTTRPEIESKLQRLKCWKLITGFRGKSADAEAVYKAVEAVAAFAAAHSAEIDELDVNPLLVLQKGAVAVDALVRLRVP
jgi:acetate---CoA ligase (ADP-forming)